MNRDEMQALVDRLTGKRFKVHVGKPLERGGASYWILRRYEPDRMYCYGITLTGRELFGVDGLVKNAINIIRQRIKRDAAEKGNVVQDDQPEHQDGNRSGQAAEAGRGDSVEHGSQVGLSEKVTFHHQV